MSNKHKQQTVAYQYMNTSGRDEASTMYLF